MFEEELAAKISSLPGIQDIQTGPITASISQAPEVVVAQTSAPESKTEESTLPTIIAASLAGAALLGCCAFLGFWIGRGCSRRGVRDQKVSLSKISDKHV